MRKKGRIGCAVCIFLLYLCACGQNSDIYLEEYEKNTIETEATETENAQQEDVSDTQMGEETGQKEICYVYICGAVECPGVYALPEGSRIFEGIQQAGGLTEDADETLVNQAGLVTDGMMIRIYTQAEAAEVRMDTTSESKVDDGKVNINSASITELMTLPGIGASKAEAIVAYREENGDFSSIEDLMNIAGIKEGIFNQIKEHIKVNN